jgi:hypothetical protein
MKKLILTKQHKILLILLKLSKGKRENIKFEDIVVELFKKFPQDFHLKGYQQYPDSGDSIKRPLYSFRDDGILLVKNMIFCLTDKGLDKAKELKNQIGRKSIKNNENFDRYIEKEILRIRNLNSFKLFLKEEFNEILDTDFFEYLGISVKTERMDFKSRIKTIKDVSIILKNEKDVQYHILYNFHKFMFKKFKKEITYKLNN